MPPKTGRLEAQSSSIPASYQHYSANCGLSATKSLSPMRISAGQKCAWCGTAASGPSDRHRARLNPVDRFYGSIAGFSIRVVIENLILSRGDQFNEAVLALRFPN